MHALFELIYSQKMIYVYLINACIFPDPFVRMRSKIKERRGWKGIYGWRREREGGGREGAVWCWSFKREEGRGMRKRKEEILPFWDKPTVIFFFFLFSFFLHFLSFLQKKKLPPWPLHDSSSDQVEKIRGPLKTIPLSFLFFSWKKTALGVTMPAWWQLVKLFLAPHLQGFTVRGKEEEKERKERTKGNKMEWKKSPRDFRILQQKNTMRKKNKKDFFHICLSNFKPSWRMM